MRWLTADTHFSHFNIIKYCTRPFLSAGEMDAVLIQNWNELVQPTDTVYHLGDFAFASPDRAKHILSCLNGHKILILGNHDRSGAKMKEWGFEEVHQSLQIDLENGIKANLSHYPYKGTPDPHGKAKFETKNLKDDGRWLLNGHVHTSWVFRPALYKNGMINVGVDKWNFRPVSENVIIDIINKHPSGFTKQE
jgi:calcineurin-like phosphoesterase family protein